MLKQAYSDYGDAANEETYLLRRQKLQLDLLETRVECMHSEMDMALAMCDVYKLKK